MTITVSQVANTQTFGAWLATTNKLANLMSQNVVTADSTNTGSITTGNTYVNGHFGVNYLYVTSVLSGGNVSSNDILTIIANVAFTNTTSNLVTITSNSTQTNVRIISKTAEITGNTLILGSSNIVYNNAVLKLSNSSFSGNIEFSGNAVFSNAVIIANNSFGVDGAVLHSNGTGMYWAPVIGNTGIVANTNGLFVNSDYIATIAANSSTFANQSVTNTFTVGTSVYFVANGNVGIGISTPEGQLTISGLGQNTSTVNTAGNLGGSIIISDTNSQLGSGGALLFSANSAAWKYASIKGLLSNSTGNTTGDITFSTRRTVSDSSLSESLRISSNGSIGIGTSSPSAKLDVGQTDSNPVIRLRANNSGVSYTQYTDSTGATTWANVSSNSTSLQIDVSNGSLNFSTNNVIRFTTVSNGNIGIGNNSPSHKLRVEGNFSISGGIYANGSLGTLNQALFSNGTSIYWSGVVNGSILTANNTDTQTFYFPMANVLSGVWANAVISDTKLYFNPSSGTLSATSFNSLSDQTKKDNIRSISDGLEKILSIRGVEFEWNDNNETSAGVVAQEIEKTLPHLVKISSTGVKSVNYDGLIAYLIEAIKEINFKLNK